MVAARFFAAIFSGANFIHFFQLYFRTLPVLGCAMLRPDKDCCEGEVRIYCEVTISEDNGVHTMTGGFRLCAQPVRSLG